LKELVKNFSSQLSKNNIRGCFGIPGSGMSLSMIDELEKKGIPFYLTNFEGSASLMAAIHGKISNSIGLSISIKGPGLTNSIPGIAASWFESLPLIHAAESHNFGSGRHFSHKRLNQKNLSSEITKGSFYLNDNLEDVSKIIDHSKSETPGPILIQMQSKLKGNSFPKRLDKLIHKRDRIAIKLLSESRKPILILGSLASRKLNNDYINSIKIPVFSTASSKGVFNEFKENSAGIYTGVGLDLSPEYNIIKNSDLVIGVGLCPKEVLSVKKFPCDSINFQSVFIKGTDKFKFNSIVHIKNFEEYMDLAKHKVWAKKELKSIFSKLNDHLLRSFLPANIFEMFNNLTTNRIRAVFDTGFFCTIGEHIWKSKSDDLCLMSGNGRYMGTSIPMAIGASLAETNIPHVVFMGDGGIGMYLSEISIAVNNNLPILFILLSDGGFASIRKSAISNKLTQNPLLVDNDWPKIFESFNISSYKCNDLVSVENIVSQWLKNTQPLFIEINFDSKKYLSMVDNLR
tara:strand:+ start:8599 stop:10143 length:1545 start_codon:yes stop_codon:yes gene_type:complete